MKKTLINALMLCCLLSTLANANEEPSVSMPVDEHAFVASIKGMEKTKILELLGDPASQEDVTNHNTGETVASIWQYHFINKDEAGDYYETTELDFIGDKVDIVVFMHNDGAEVAVENNMVR